MKMKTETNVSSIMKKDGVQKRILDEKINYPIDIWNTIFSMPMNKSWCYRIINTENNSATLIAQKKGEGNRRHYHPDWNEWWYIFQGSAIWEVDGKQFDVHVGDMILIEKGKWHKITTVSNELCIRLAVSRSDVEHVYE